MLASVSSRPEKTGSLGNGICLQGKIGSRCSMVKSFKAEMTSELILSLPVVASLVHDPRLVEDGSDSSRMDRSGPRGGLWPSRADQQTRVVFTCNISTDRTRM